jgi:hypothetical protein
MNYNSKFNSLNLTLIINNRFKVFLEFIGLNGGIFTVIIKCKKCGNEYVINSDEEVSDFKCECGGELSYTSSTTSSDLKDDSTDNLKTEIKLEKTDKALGKKRKWMIGVCCVCLILAVTMGGMLLTKTTISGNTPTETLASNSHIQNSTYSKNGLKFEYPSGWKQISNLHYPSRWGFPDPSVSFYQPIGNYNETYIETYFYIKQRDVHSLDEMLRDYRKDIANIGQTEVSERNITINGMKAVELIKTWHTGKMQYKALTVHFEAVPGSKYYRIGCVVPEDQYNQTLPIFEMVVNSFKPT